jgi:hypothetical protein
LIVIGIVRKCVFLKDFNMKKLILLAVLAGFLFVSAAMARDPNDPNAPAKEPRFRGKVAVVKNAEGVIAEVKLESRRLGTFDIVLDAKGKELGEKMAGKNVVIKGTVVDRGGKKWLTVESYKEIQRPPQSSGRKAPAAPPKK